MRSEDRMIVNYGIKRLQDKLIHDTDTAFLTETGKNDGKHRANS